MCLGSRRRSFRKGYHYRMNVYTYAFVYSRQMGARISLDAVRIAIAIPLSLEYSSEDNCSIFQRDIVLSFSLSLSFLSELRLLGG